MSELSNSCCDDFECCLCISGQLSLILLASFLSRFSNLGILHVTKRGVVEVLTKRLREERRRLKEPGYKFSGKTVVYLLNWLYMMILC